MLVRSMIVVSACVVVTVVVHKSSYSAHWGY